MQSRAIIAQEDEKNTHKGDKMSTSDSPWITTFSGRQFFITRATVDDIYIEDIAHGLSNVCRYAGQPKTFYSVAEHSVRMAEALSYDPAPTLVALLHDAAEAYLGDVTSMVKDCLPEYKKMEQYLQYVIYDKYGIRHCPLMNPDIDMVKALDVAIRTPEVKSLFPVGYKAWSWKLVEYDYGKIRPWSHKKAEEKFLKMFHQLYKEAV